MIQSIQGWHSHLRLGARALIALACFAACCGMTASAAGTSLVFGEPVVLSNALFSTPMSVAADDLNGDGRPDIVYGNNFGSPYIFFNAGGATPFAGVSPTVVAPDSQTQQVYVADMDRDDKPDLIAVGFNGPTLVYFNNGSASPFSADNSASVTRSDAATAIAAADVNGDGYPDLAAANTNHIPSRLYLTTGSRLPSALTVDLGTDTGYANDILLTDVNGDGLPDALISYMYFEAPPDPSGIVIYLHNGTSNPYDGVTPIRLFDRKSISRLAVADVNSDSKPDLVFTNDSNMLGGVLLNTGSGTAPFADADTFNADPNVYACFGIVIKDVNADSLPDIVLNCAPPGPSYPYNQPPEDPSVAAIYLNNGSAHPFLNVAAVDIDSTSQTASNGPFAVADLSGTGSLSIVTTEKYPVSYRAIIVDQQPITRDDSYSTPIGQFIDADVLANDTDADGTLDRSSLKITVTPLHGVVRINPANYTVIYQPDAPFTGKDSFSYVVTDNYQIGSSPGTVTVTVQAAPSSSGGGSGSGSGDSGNGSNSGGGGGGAVDWLTLLALALSLSAHKFSSDVGMRVRASSSGCGNQMREKRR